MEAIPQTNILSSSLDEAVTLPPCTMNNFKQCQELMKMVADSLLIEEIQETEHKLLDILYAPSSAWVALPIN